MIFWASAFRAMGAINIAPTGQQQPPAPAMRLGDVSLGISAEEFEAALNAPVEWQGNLGTCHYDYRREPTHSEILALPAELRPQAEKDPASLMLDVLITVEGTFDRGRLVTLSAWKIESY